MHQCYNLSLFFPIEQTSILQTSPVMFKSPQKQKKKRPVLRTSPLQ